MREWNLKLFSEDEDANQIEQCNQLANHVFSQYNHSVSIAVNNKIMYSNALGDAGEKHVIITQDKRKHVLWSYHHVTKGHHSLQLCLLDKIKGLLYHTKINRKKTSSLSDPPSAG